MEYIVFWAAIGMLLLFVFLKGAWDARKNQKVFIQKLYKDYGKLPEREYKVERFLRIDSYFKKHPKEGQIDDITWNDLNMDDVFKRMNHTLSSTGEEYLYYTLRTPAMEPTELENQEKMVEFFDTHPDERVKVQLLMRRLGTTGKYSLYDYMEYLGVLGKRSNAKILTLDILLVGLIGLSFVNLSVGLFGVAALLIYNITNYYKDKREIEPYITSFGYVMRLLDVSDRVLKLPLPPCKKQQKTIGVHKRRLAKMRQGSGWVLSGMSPGSGNPLEILGDYVNMALHIDIMIFNRMLAQLNQHLEDVDVLVTALGQIETAVCIAAYRRSMVNGWCKPVWKYSGDRDAAAKTGSGEIAISIEEAYHPLIDRPVKNSIHTHKGVLLTGSNASGKSTFLKTVAVSAIMAQTINTCPADSYESCFFNIYSSMTLRDDIDRGESYFIVEIKSLKRIVDQIGQRPVLCFVDEVLRGTNTVERIAASAQILKSLGRSDMICFAATHDIELTEILKRCYDNYHFEEEIRDGDIIFSYKLLSGKATTRNAIRLLEIMGYDEDIIAQATSLAENFMNTGVWRLTGEVTADIL